MTKTTEENLSQSKYAEHRNVTKGYISRMVKACTPYIFAILVSRQGMIRGQTSSGVESGVLNNQIEIKFYSKLDDGLSAQPFPA